MLCRCCLYASALVLFDITLSQIFTTAITRGMWKIQPTLGSFTLSSVQLENNNNYNNNNNSSAVLVRVAIVGVFVGIIECGRQQNLSASFP